MSVASLIKKTRLELIDEIIMLTFENPDYTYKSPIHHKGYNKALDDMVSELRKLREYYEGQEG